MKPILTILLLTLAYTVSLAQSSTIEANKQVVRQYFEEIINKKQLERVDQVFDKDYLFINFLDNGKSPGRQQMHDFLPIFFAAFPDIHYTITDLIAEGDWVAVRCMANGTQKGAFWSYPASNQPLNGISEIFFYKIKDEKIIESRRQLDMQALDKALSLLMTEASFMNFIAAWEKEPTATFEKTMAPKFLFVGHDGTPYDRAKLLRMISGNQYSSIKVENLNVRNFGSTAVVTGIITANYAQAASHFIYTKDAFTYTFQNQGGNWKAISMSHAKVDYGMRK